VDLPTAIEKYWSHAAALAGGIYAAWTKSRELRDKRRTDDIAAATARHVAKLDLTKLAQQAAAEVINTLREEVARLSGELDDVRDELRDLQREHIKMMADKDAKIALQEGRIRQLEASIAAHRRLMLAAGMDLPPEPAFFEIRNGEVTTPTTEAQP
jgi:septal ring factor EnvC (AmiA/AmiB activator)